VISTLFTTGFLTGAASGTFIGGLADRFGRKAACLVFCLVYTLSCVLTMKSPTASKSGTSGAFDAHEPGNGGGLGPLLHLFAGRVLGGLGTSLLFSVFDSWMVADFHERGLAKKGGDLSRTFGTMSTLNSITAILSGVASEWLVASTGTRKAPFMASVGLLALAAWVIATQWVSLRSLPGHFVHISIATNIGD
jgi:MFS family permease